MTYRSTFLLLLGCLLGALAASMRPAPVEPRREHLEDALRACELSRDWYADRWFADQEAIRGLAGEGP